MSLKARSTGARNPARNPVAPQGPFTPLLQSTPAQVPAFSGMSTLLRPTHPYAWTQPQGAGRLFRFEIPTYCSPLRVAVSKPLALYLNRGHVPGPGAFWTYAVCATDGPPGREHYISVAQPEEGMWYALAIPPAPFTRAEIIAIFIPLLPPLPPPNRPRRG